MKYLYLKFIYSSHGNKFVILLTLNIIFYRGLIYNFYLHFFFSLFLNLFQWLSLKIISIFILIIWYIFNKYFPGALNLINLMFDVQPLSAFTN
jgi:hypothetical protein